MLIEGCELLDHARFRAACVDQRSLSWMMKWDRTTGPMMRNGAGSSDGMLVAGCQRRGSSAAATRQHGACLARGVLVAGPLQLDQIQ